MKLILLEKVHNLGDLGDTVTVRPGFGRNFLLPRGKALPATRENVEMFEARRAELEARGEALEGTEVQFIVNVSPEGKLYGSIGAREIAEKLTEMGKPLEKSEVDMPEGPIRVTGEFELDLLLHADVQAHIRVIVSGEEEAA